MKTSKAFVCILLAAAFFAGGTSDLCDGKYNEETLYESVQVSATPKGGTKAGKYTKDRKAHDLKACILSCCKNETCNVAFLHASTTCYLIQCNASYPGGCTPETRTGAKYKDTYMITARAVATPQPESETTYDYYETQTDDVPNDVRVECSDADDCHRDEECKLIINADMIGYGCVCKDGYVRQGLTCRPRYRPRDRSCEFGLIGDCYPEEECTAPINSRSRVGRCSCIEGYAENSDTGWCEELKDSRPSQGSKKGTGDASSKRTKAKDKKVPSTTTPKTVETLTVSAGGNQEIQLPKNQLTLSAFAIPSGDNDEYQYEWSLEKNPPGEKVGNMEGINSANLKLSQLVAGLYTFKVAVSADGKYGDTTVNVTVKPPARVNKAPQVTITPTTQHVSQPNDVVLDGSPSSDDDKIVSYHWELVSGPLIDKKAHEANMDRPMLVLKGLSAGDYKFKLTVTDSDGVTNSTFADVQVIKEVDYPPKANAGSNVILSLPKNSVTLYGNQSTDDKGIASYEWKQHEDSLTADMVGVRTPVLKLQNLQVGDYTFTLKVTDTAGQTSTADVHVFVKPEHNKAPVAKVGKDETIFLPRDTVILNGTNSTDDQKISSFKWTQVSGNNKVLIENPDRALATVSKLTVGIYKFKLTVTDEEGLKTSAQLTVTVKENENHPPKADAGGDKQVNLPVSMVILNGSASSDDRGIHRYQWTREDKSLAVGDVLNGSDHHPILQLTNLIPGRYFFTLEVEDDEGLKSTDSASIIVNADEHINDVLELHVEADIKAFTQANKKTLEDELALLIHRSSQEGETEVKIQRIYQGPTARHLIATFLVASVTKEHRVIESGPDVVQLLKNKLRSNSGVVDFTVLLIDTLVCQNNCSEHGHCDSTTKLCDCEAFWMQNPFRFYVLDGQSNCEWSVLYVIIISFLSVIGITALLWGLICLCRRWFKYRPKKRHRYTLLDEADEDDKRSSEMLPKECGDGDASEW